MPWQRQGLQPSKLARSEAESELDSSTFQKLQVTGVQCLPFRRNIMMRLLRLILVVAFALPSLVYANSELFSYSRMINSG